MEYEQASKIRKARLSDLVADAPGGALKSYKSAVGLKMRAAATGLQEKADYLYWAKKIGMGGILGKLTGRSQASIKYFSENKGKKGSATRLSSAGADMQPVGSSEQMTEGSASILTQMFLFMKKSREQDLKTRETQRSFAEERQNESQKKHDEFITVLKKFANVSQVKEPKEKSEGIFDFIKNMFGSFKDTFGKMIELALSAWAWLKGLKWLTTLGEWARGMLLAGSWKEMFTAAARSSPALAFLAPWLMAADIKDEIRADPYNPKYDNNPFAMQLRGEAKTEGEATEINRRKSLKQVPRKQVEMFVNSDQTDDELKVEFGADRNMLKKWLDENKNPASMWQAPVTPLSGTDRGAAKIGTVTPVDSTRQKAIAEESRSTFAATDPRMEKVGTKIEAVSTPLPPIPTSAPVSKLVTENADLNTSAIAGITPAPGPIITGQSSSGSLSDNQVSASASQRDSTHILDRVLQATKAFAH